MLQHLKRLRREWKILLQIALRNTRRVRRAWAWPRNQFWVESLLQGDFVEDWWKKNFRISRRTFKYIVRVVGPDLLKRDTKLDQSLSRKSCKWYLGWKKMPSFTWRIVGIRKSVQSFPCRKRDNYTICSPWEVKYYPATSGYICHLDLGYQL